MPIPFPPGFIRDMTIDSLVLISANAGVTVSPAELRARLEQKTDTELSAMVHELNERLAPCGVYHCQCSCHDPEDR